MGQLKKPAANSGSRIPAPKSGDSGSTQKMKPQFSFEFLREKILFDQAAAIADMQRSDWIRNRLNMMARAEIARKKPDVQN